MLRNGTHVKHRAKTEATRNESWIPTKIIQSHQNTLRVPRGTKRRVHSSKIEALSNGRVTEYRIPPIWRICTCLVLVDHEAFCGHQITYISDFDQVTKMEIPLVYEIAVLNQQSVGTVYVAYVCALGIYC